MRLLHTTTRSLHEFAPNKLPIYAILSHTWGDLGDEVSMADLEGSASWGKSPETKAGYAKIRLACAQAVLDEIEFIWVDTCCIDKTSSAELSEAINSMYQWYYNAVICYAYIEDVDEELPLLQFPASRWFTRGWTLQELIAPFEVLFFSKQWAMFGTKTTLRTTIAQVTGIAERVLLDRNSLAAMSIAKRMSWASKRQTSRPEDIAYCLMGLFEVNIPMLYGEGEKAFIRLQEEIMKYSDDQSLFAWRSHACEDGVRGANVYRGLLASHPDCFAESGNIVPYRGRYSDTTCTMTNQGLRIKLHLSPLDKQTFGATLNCPAPPDLNGFVGIFLQRISSGDQQYARVRASEFYTADRQGEEKTVHVRQQNVLPSEEGIFQQHLIQLRNGPNSQSEYRSTRTISEEGKYFKSVPLGFSPNTWLQGGISVFPLAKISTRLSVVLCFEGADGRKVLILIGSTDNSDIGFTVVTLSRHQELPHYQALQVRYQAPFAQPGGHVVVGDDRVGVQVESLIYHGNKYYITDVSIRSVSGVIGRGPSESSAVGLPEGSRQNGNGTPTSRPSMHKLMIWKSRK